MEEMEKKKSNINKEEKNYFLKLAEILAREKLIKETEKKQLQKLIRQKWE